MVRRWLAWHGLFRLQERLKGHPTFAILADMERADRLTRPALEAQTAARLAAFVRECYASSPFLRRRFDEAGVRPEQIQGPADLARLPLLTKDDVRQHRAELRSPHGGRMESRATGGSTGAPLIFDVPMRRIASQVACRQRVARWFGLQVGDPEIALWGSPIETGRHDWIKSARDWAMATRLLSAFEMNAATMSRYLDILERGPCAQIFAYPSAIERLCRHAQAEGRDLTRAGVRVVFVTGEVLYPFQRELIAATLNCAVADGYGGRDSGFIAHECPQGGMHLMADAMVVELIGADGRAAAPGESGEIVATDLYSDGAPFLRYATGDMAVASSRVCPCGRPMPLIERLEGRRNDSIYARDGRVINSLALIYPVREIAGIEHFRVVQEEISRFRVEIVRGAAYPADAEARIATAWRKLLRDEVAVEFAYPASFAAEKSGKLRHVISKVAGTAAATAERVDV
ncbi:MAG: phenylacetate--CoA ligase family protein [Bryobacterales bacterium]|nr:phenylacetate--CoA ligase family protein [Bryobacterales bacterium]